MQSNFKTDEQVIGEWLRTEIVRLISEAELPGSVQDQFSRKISNDRCYELAEEFVGRFEDYDLITDKFPDEEDIYEELFRTNFDMNEECLKEFGHSLEYVEAAVEAAADRYEAAPTESELTIPVEGDHWIEFAYNTGANAMMKKIRDINTGSIWMNLKKEIVYVSAMEATFADRKDEKGVCNERFV